MQALVLSASDISAVTDRSELRQAMVRCLKDLSAQTATNFPRQVVALDRGRALGFMPAHTPAAFGYKAVSVMAGNRLLNRNPHQGIVVLTEYETGEVKAILEGSTVTAMRTAAVSAAATDVLSRREARHLAVFGTGRQAFEHALAIAEVRPLKKIVIHGRSREKLGSQLGEHLPCEIALVETVHEALSDAEIIVTCTSSHEVLFDINDVPAGAHVNAIGACRPGQQEVILRSRASVYLDSREACFAEASEVFEALSSCRLDSVRGEIGDLFLEKVGGRVDRNDVTVFKSVGLGIEDVAAAQYIFAKAKAMQRGIQVDLRGG